MGPLPARPGCDCHICRPDKWYDQLDRRVIDTVLTHGWQVMLVAEGAGCNECEHDDQPPKSHEEGLPAFAYTVGLGHRAGHPELVMSGLDHGVMHRALNALAQRVIAGRVLAPGDVVENVLAGVPVAIEQMAGTGLVDTVTWSGWFHRRTPEALTVVWPDRNGVFAWQPGAAELLSERQPAEWRVPLEHSGGLAVDPRWPFPVPPDHRAFSCTHVVDDGQTVLWVARQSKEDRGEDWTAHCGASGHATADIRLVHLAHLVRSAPSLRQLSDLRMDVEAWRSDPDCGWERASIAS